MYRKGDRVSTPLGPAGVAYIRMAPPTFSEVAVVSVVLDARLNDINYTGTIFKAADVTPLPNYQVIVGNIGTVYDGESETEATAAYVEYRRQSVDNYGRAAGEEVTLMTNGEPTLEYYPAREGERD